MRLKQYITEIRKTPITMKLTKKGNDYVIGKYKISPSLSRFDSDSKGNPKPAWKIWNGTSYLDFEYKTLTKAKQTLQNMVNKDNK